MPDTSWAALIGFALLALVGAALALYSRRSSGEILAAVQDEWGDPDVRRSQDAHRSAEAWRHLDGGQYGPYGVDEHTWSDLDLDSVLEAVDRTHTGLGAQMLHRRMRTGAAWVEAPGYERLVERFGESPELRETTALTLQSGGRALGHALWTIARPHLIQVRWWFWTFPVLTLLMVGAIAAIPFEVRSIAVVIVLAGVHMVIRGAVQWQTPGLLAPMRQIAPLIRIAQRLAAVPEVAAVAPVGTAEALKRLGGLRSIASWIARDPAAADESSSLAEWVNLLFLLDANALLFGSRYLRRDGGVLCRTACWIGDVDLALSIASVRAEPRLWCVPAWRERGGARVDGLWHPLLSDPVENDVELVPGSGLIITGANASGKTTYMRTVGIAAVLARVLDTCPARAWTGESLRVRSLVGVGDDLAGGRSYYQVEVDRIVELLDDAEDELPTLFLLDELLRGTNRIDRLAAGEAILRSLVRPVSTVRRHSAMIATHDAELVDQLADLYAPWHFRETVDDRGLTFEYRRHPGPARTRTALALLEAAGADRSIVDYARTRAGEIEGRAAAPRQAGGARQ